MNKQLQYKKPRIFIKKLKLDLFYSRRMDMGLLGGDGIFLAPLCTNGQWIDPCFIKDTKIILADK